MFNFGFKKVEESEKIKLVSDVFTSVASKYDIMNNVMSFGLQNVWKKNFVDLISIKDGGKYLDLASGTGDIAKMVLQKAENEGKNIEIVLCDANKDMLEIAKSRFSENVKFVISNAEEMTFEEGEFDGVFISFGIRNFTNIETSLQKIRSSLKDGGGLFCLEFFPDVSKLGFFNKIYRQYLLQIIPKMGKIIVGDEGSYKYFGESILNFYSKKDFKNLLQKENFRFFSSNEGFLEIVSFFHFKK